MIWSFQHGFFSARFRRVASSAQRATIVAAPLTKKTISARMFFRLPHETIISIAAIS
jgi:hypothetical protein